ncbi:mycofactocin-coupled SDR family oxidoreductase [Gordonia sp. NPDC127522]|uniref:mycofactocin-coupled SDR family oxidoreductase n=1 Tax=Gordonia sp. NPDC127522 TaxID=3345390 RepID=UPI003634E779
MGRVDNKVVFITGAARGQGREFARLLASEGADIIGTDICDDVVGMPYPMASRDELAETQRLVEAEGRRALMIEADVRDGDAMDEAVRRAYEEFGRIDVVIANAGISNPGPKMWEITEDAWNAQIDIMLTGVWRTIKPVIPRMIEDGTRGSIIMISSVAGIKPEPHVSAYAAAKAGEVALGNSLAKEVAEYGIRVNTVHPTSVDADIIRLNYPLQRSVRPDLDRLPTREEFGEAVSKMNIMPVWWLDPIDVAYGVLYLASDESRYVTGTRLSIDAGASIR